MFVTPHPTRAAGRHGCAARTRPACPTDRRAGLAACAAADSPTPPADTRATHAGTASLRVEASVAPPPAAYEIPVALYDGALRSPLPAGEIPDHWLSAVHPVQRLPMRDPDGRVVGPPRLLPTWQLVLPIWIESAGLRSSPGLTIEGALGDAESTLTIRGLELGGQPVPRLVVRLSPTPAD
jgi:hypothetical protein